MDWNNYQRNFPAKYIPMSRAMGDKIYSICKANTINTVVDIGGGKNSAIFMHIIINANTKIYLLDPYIIDNPSWISEKVGWDIHNVYDLGVCKGAINYLSIDQIRMIPTMCKRFVINTYNKAPSTTWKSSEFTTLNDKEGTERVRKNGPIIEHQLVFKDKMITHTFWDYKIKDLKQWLGNCNTKRYNNNSILLYKE